MVCDTRNVTAVPGECREQDRVCLLPVGQPDRGNVFVSGRPVCDDEWDVLAAAAVCRALGYTTGLPKRESWFGPVPRDFIYRSPKPSF